MGKRAMIVARMTADDELYQTMLLANIKEELRCLENGLLFTAEPCPDIHIFESRKIYTGAARAINPDRLDEQELEFDFLEPADELADEDMEDVEDGQLVVADDLADLPIYEALLENMRETRELEGEAEVDSFYCFERIKRRYRQ